MEYFGIFLILVAAALGLAGQHFRGPSRAPRNTATMRAIHFDPPGAAGVLVAAAGVFIFATSISSR